MHRCRICSGEESTVLKIREMQHCLRSEFLYFQCLNCKCIQIEKVPEDMAQFYPSDYYSFSNSEDKGYEPADLGLFRKIQSEYLLHNHRPLLGKLLTLGFKTPPFYHWIKKLKLGSNERILDVGCGTGLLLKKMHQLGFTDLTGIDPFIPRDYAVGKGLNIYKTDVFQLNARPFDCIMLHHSFEHMGNPQSVLDRLRTLLKPGGRILLRIPVVSDHLLNIFGTHLVSLDAPRHFFIHTEKSLGILCHKAGLSIAGIEYDSDDFAFWASEQYKNDICLSASNSYAKNRKASMFSKEDIKTFRKKIKQLNQEDQSDNAAFYLQPA